MIKGNKKIAKILAVAMCAGVFANAGVAGYVNAYADSSVNDSAITENEETVGEEEVATYNSSANTGWTFNHVLDPETDRYVTIATAVANNLKIEADRDKAGVVNITGFVSGQDIDDTIPGYVTVEGMSWKVGKINDYALTSCRKFENLKISGVIESIGRSAFAGTTSETVDIEYGVKSIGSYAFSSCTSLKSINIPNSVTSIGSDVFYNCKPDIVINVGSDAVKELLIKAGVNEENINFNN